MMNSRKNKQSRAGFTLIELLTVIAIIGILAAILIPVVGRVRESARTAQCSSNIRQITLGMIAFADENQGRFPSAASQGSPDKDDWIFWQGNNPIGRNHPHATTGIQDSLIFNYLGGAMHDLSFMTCPSDQFHQNFDYPSSYMVQGHMARNGSTSSTVFGNYWALPVENPASRMIVMIEEGHSGERGAIGYHGSDAFGGPRNDGVVWIENNNKLAARHNTKGHASFADGHIELVTPAFAADRRNSQVNWDGSGPATPDPGGGGGGGGV